MHLRPSNYLKYFHSSYVLIFNAYVDNYKYIRQMKKIAEINGHDFYKALSSGIINVISKQDYLNSINVFPVPDGDTGTNLMFTLKPIIQIDEKKINNNIEKTLLLISDNALNSARGNSGTIIAQYLIGFADGAKDHQSINSKNIFGNLSIIEK